MRKLKYEEYIDELNSTDKYIRYLTKKIYTPILKRYSENNGVKYMGVDDAYFFHLKKQLLDFGEYVIDDITIKAKYETVLVIETFSKSEYEEIKNLEEYKDYEFVYNKDESTYMAEVERKIMTVSYSQNNQ